MKLIPWKEKRPQGSGTLQRAGGDPFGPVFAGMDRLFSDLWAPWTGSQAHGGRSWLPTMDVSESEDAFTVKVELPGVDPEDLDVTVTGDLLTLSGEKKEDREEKDGSWHRVERRFGSFQRSLRLPAPVDPDKVEVKHRHGVLSITLGKEEAARPRRIPVMARKD